MGEEEKSENILNIYLDIYKSHFQINPQNNKNYIKQMKKN